MQSRITKIARAARDAGASAAYLRNTPDIEWASGFKHTFDEERAHALLIGTGTAPVAVLHTDSRYQLACVAGSIAQGGHIVVDKTPVSHAKWLKAELGKGGEGEGVGEQKIAIEDTITLREYESLINVFAPATAPGEADAAAQSAPATNEEKPSTPPSPFIVTRDLVLGLRAVKDADEVTALKAAQAITDAAFEKICDFIKPGMTEIQVARALDSFMFELGADSLAFPTIVATGANGASPHAQPGQNTLRRGHAIVMDFGARKDGYCSDMTRTVFLGHPRGQMERAWKCATEINAAVREMLAPGVTGADAQALCDEMLLRAEFDGCMGHSLGHGVGIEIHEEPRLAKSATSPLVAGNVVTVEPGIYMEGEFGIRVEDFGVVTETGFETFTKSTHDLIVL